LAVLALGEEGDVEDLFGCGGGGAGVGVGGDEGSQGTAVQVLLVSLGQIFLEVGKVDLHCIY
jgi:hypothetical protein